MKKVSIVTPKVKAFVATVGFTLVGLCAWQFFIFDYIRALPLAIFYVTIVINTYFSIKLFAEIIPKENAGQKLLDTVLAFLYVGMALEMGDPKAFVFMALLLFIVAAAKYAFLLGIVHHPKLLKRKIIVDTSGVFACALALGGILAGFPKESAWAFAIVFVIVNLILFFVHPLYRFDEGVPLEWEGFL